MCLVSMPLCLIPIEGWRVISDTVGHLAWPLVIGLFILVFRGPIAGLISDIEEGGWGNAKIKLGNGNRRSHELKLETAPDNDSGDEVDRSPSEMADDEPAAGAESASLPGPDGAALSSADVMQFYGRVVGERLERSKYNTSTTSAKLGAEIVGTTYADLKQTLRMVAFLLGTRGGPRGRLARFEPTIASLGLPRDLEEDIRRARQLAIDVTETKTAQVNGQGASDYIDSVRSMVRRLIDWGIGQVATTK